VLGDNITLRGHGSNNAALVTVNGGGMLVMNSGSVIAGNTNISSGYGFDYGGGGVRVSPQSTYHAIPYGTFIMRGGARIENNSAHNGGGVFVGGTLVMDGNAIIYNNTARNSGGGVFVNAYGGLLILRDSASIAANTAVSSGGGVFLGSGWQFDIHGARFYMEDAPTIGGNRTTGASGGGVYVGGGAYPVYGVFTMRGGTISANRAEGGGNQGTGGGVHNSGAFRIQDGHILGVDTEASLAGNFAAGVGGGAAMYNAAAAQHGTFNGAFNSYGSFPSANIDSAILVINGRLQLTGTVRVSGIPQVGRTLTADLRTLVGAGPPSFQWYRGQNSSFTAIPGATGQTHIAQTADLTLRLRVRVSLANSDGYVISQESDVIGPWEDLGNVFFQLSTYAPFQNLPAGATSSAGLVAATSGRLRLAEYWDGAAASPAIIHEDDANRLRLTVGYNWGGIDLLHDGFEFQAGDTILITGRVVEGGNRIALNSNPVDWRPIGGEHHPPEGGTFEIEHTLTPEDITVFTTLPGDPPIPRLRIMGDITGATFYITELIVTRESPQPPGGQASIDISFAQFQTWPDGITHDVGSIRMGQTGDINLNGLPAGTTVTWLRGAAPLGTGPSLNVGPYVMLGNHQVTVVVTINDVPFSRLIVYRVSP